VRYLDRSELCSLLGLIGVSGLMRDILLWGKEKGLTVRDKRFCKTLRYLLKHLLGFILCKL
jgi:hypothetical protein